jgi:hypothetical protein
LFCWIERGPDHLGALRFQQIDLKWSDNWDIFLTLDAGSHELMVLADVLWG